MRIALVRHGETDWNGAGRLQGRLDIPLNSRGEGQARACGALLEKGSWCAVISSPLSRARRTAELLAERAGIALLLEDAALVERDYGQAAGMTEQERDRLWPEGDCPGMESMEDVGVRMHEALLRTTEEFFPRDVVMVTHGTALLTLLVRLFGGDGRDALAEVPPNGAVCCLCFAEGRFTLEKSFF